MLLDVFVLDCFWIQFIDYKHSNMSRTETFLKDSENYFASILDNFYSCYHAQDFNFYDEIDFFSLFITARIVRDILKIDYFSF